MLEFCFDEKRHLLIVRHSGNVTVEDLFGVIQQFMQEESLLLYEFRELNVFADEASLISVARNAKELSRMFGSVKQLRRGTRRAVVVQDKKHTKQCKEALQAFTSDEVVIFHDEQKAIDWLLSE